MNEQTKEKKVVHHDRLSPIKEGKVEEGVARDMTINRKAIAKDCTPENTDTSDLTDSETSDSDDSDGYNPDTDDDNQHGEHEAQQRQYPLRNRRARQIPNNIPWSAIHI